MIKIFAAILLVMSFAISANDTHVHPALGYNITSIESRLVNNASILKLTINIVDDGKYVTAKGVNDIVAEVKNGLLSTWLTNNPNAIIQFYIMHYPPSPSLARVIGIILDVGNGIQYKKLFIDRLWIES